MDAISVLKRTIFILSATLLVAGSGMAQITVSSTSVALNSTNNTSQPVSVTSTPSGTNFTFTISETNLPGVQWLQACTTPTNCATGNMGSASDTTNTTLTIRLYNGLAGQGSGPFLATVSLTPMGSTTVAATINVTFTPGQSTGSTPVNPSSLTVGVPNGGSATNTLTLTNNTGGTINITSVAPAASNDTWLKGVANPATVAAGSQNTSTITVTTTGTGLSNQSLSDSLVITIQNQPSVSVPVTFNVGTGGLTLSTVSAAFAYPNGTSQQAVTVSGVTSYNATASTTDTNNWLILSVAPQSGLSQSGLQVTNVPVNTQLNLLLGTAVYALATGNYTGSVVVSDVNSSSTATISVTLAVNGSATSITVSPPPLSGTTPQINFYAQTNGSSVPNQSLWISAPAGTFTASVTSNNTPWLGLGASGGTIPGSLQVYASNVSSLAAGTYTGQITLTAGSLTQTVNVALTVSTNPVAFAGFTTVTGTNGTVLFTSGGTASQQVSVFASDGPGDPLTVSNIVAPNWLTVTQSGTQLTIMPNVSGQSAVLDSGYVTLTATNTAGTIANPNSQVSIPVVLATGANGGTLTITSSQPLTFTSSASGVTPGYVTVFVSAATATPFTVSTPTPWVSIQTGSFLTNQNFTVTVTPGTLAPNSVPYTGEIDFVANGVTQKLSVSLTVTGGSSSGNVSADKSMLAFTGVAGGQAQSSAINVTSNGASVPFTASVTVQGAGTWLSSDTSSASTPKQVTITADPTTLAAGIYQGTVTIKASNTVTIPVTFTVQAPPMVSAGATNLTFTYFSGGSVPVAQSVLISGSTGGFTATAASDTGSWLMVTPTSGAAGTSISVSVDPTGIAIGSHTGTVTVAGTGGLTGQAVINVSLTITAPLPSVSSLGNAASYVPGTAAPGEVITLMGTNLGPATPVTAQLDANGNLATQLGGVQVLVSGIPAPMVYVSATQVSAVVPYEVARFSVAAVKVTYLSQTSNIETLPVVPTAPGIFTQSQSGIGAVGYNGDFSVNGPNNPAAKGSTMVFFLTGEGQTNPPGKTGTINSSPNQNPMPVAGISVTIDGQPTTYSYAGGIEGVVEGIMQLNVVVPAAARSGTVPIQVTIGGNSTQSGVTVSLR